MNGIFNSFNKKKKASTIIINWEQIQCSWNNISINNGEVYVDGKKVKWGLKGITKVEFKWDLANLDCSNADIYGNVHWDVDGSIIDIGWDVWGDVDGSNISVEWNVSGKVIGSNIN